MSRFTLKKSERLCSKKDITKLFSAGKSWTQYPFRVTLLILEQHEDPGTKVIFGVSRKLYKKAIKRNLIKRRTREAFRLQKNTLDEKLNGEKKTMLLMLNYIGQEVLPYHFFEKNIGIIIDRLMKGI